MNAAPLLLALPVIWSVPIVSQEKRAEVLCPRDGVVILANVKEKQPVKRGQLLARLDDQTAADDLERVTRQLAEAARQKARAQAAYDESRQRFDTALALRQRGCISIEELAAAREHLDGCARELNGATARVARLQVALNEGRLLVDMHIARVGIQEGDPASFVEAVISSLSGDFHGCQ